MGSGSHNIIYIWLQLLRASSENDLSLIALICQENSTWSTSVVLLLLCLHLLGHMKILLLLVVFYGLYIMLLVSCNLSYGMVFWFLSNNFPPIQQWAAGFIHAKENEWFLGNLCCIIKASRPFFGIMNNNLDNTDLTGLDTLPGFNLPIFCALDQEKAVYSVCSG